MKYGQPDLLITEKIIKADKNSLALFDFEDLVLSVLVGTKTINITINGLLYSGETVTQTLNTSLVAGVNYSLHTLGMDFSDFINITQISIDLSVSGEAVWIILFENMTITERAVVGITPSSGLTLCNQRTINARLSVVTADSNNDSLTVNFYNAVDDSLLGTTSTDTSGTAYVFWNNLLLDSEYSWYVTVNYNGNVITSATYTFSTETLVNHMNFNSFNPRNDDFVEDPSGGYGSFREVTSRSLGASQNINKREGGFPEKIENPVSRAEKDNVVPSNTTRNNNFSDATISNPAGEDLASDGVAVPSASNVAKDVGKKPNRWGF